MAQILDGKYIIELDALTNIELIDWLVFQPNTVLDQAYRISLEDFISALPIIPAVAGEYDNIAAMLAAQGGQTADVFYKVADPSDDPDYNDLADSEIKSVYYHLVEDKTGSLSDYNSIAIPKLESSKFPKLGNSLEALTFDVKFRTAEWSSNKATLQAIANALKLSSPQDLLLDALSLKLNTDNNPTDISRVLFGLDGQLIFEPISSSKIQSDSDSGDVTLDDDYALLLTITGNQNIASGLANIGITAKSFSTAAITAFQASGNNRVRATSATHGFSEGDYVEIVNTANYDGIYEIKAVPNINDFDFTATFVATETGDWEKSENREIAVDLRVDTVSQKEFTRQIEGDARLNFSEQLSGVVSGEDIDVYVKSNTAGEAIEILGTSQNSTLKIIRSDEAEPNTWYVSTNGKDSNTGSKASEPFKNISAAISVYSAGDIIRIIDEGYSSNENITISKKTTIIGPAANITGGAAFTQLQGTWTIDGGGISIIFENITTVIDFSSSVVFNLDVINGAVGSASSLPARLTELILHNSHYSLGGSSNLRSFECHSCTGIASSLQIGRSFTLNATSHEGSITSGIDASQTGTLKNSSIDTDLTITGDLDTENSTISGTLAVSGTISGGNRFPGQVTVQGKTLTFTATPTFNLDDGNVQEMILTSNVTSLTLSNELDAGSYLIYLIQDGTGGHTIPTPDSTWGDPTDNSVDPANFLTGANDRNLINVAVSPSGFTEFSIETHDI